MQSFTDPSERRQGVLAWHDSMRDSILTKKNKSIARSSLLCLASRVSLWRCQYSWLRQEWNGKFE